MKKIRIKKIIDFTLVLLYINFFSVIVLIALVMSGFEIVCPDFLFYLFCSTMLWSAAEAIGLITTGDFDKRMNGEEIKENELLIDDDDFGAFNWRFSGSFWILTFILQLVMCIFPWISIAILNFLTGVNYSLSQINYSNDLRLSHLLIINLPVFFFVCRSFLLRPIRNERSIQELHRINKLIEISQKKNNVIYLYEALKNDGLALHYADKSDKENRQIVMFAVMKSGRALEFADYSMKKDKEIVLMAVKNDGTALEFAHKSLRKDRDIVFEAIKTSGKEAQNFAHDSLKNDPELLNAFHLWFSDILDELVEEDNKD